MKTILTVIGTIWLWIHRYEVLSMIESLVDLYLGMLGAVLFA
mgnify:CR=1 FL=1